MGKRLIIAEKPSVGRDIANVLNCRENGKGCRIGRDDIVTWAVGHLVGLCSPDEIDEKYVEWKLEDLPIFPDPFPLRVLESGRKQFEIVKSLINDPGVDRIVCATDAGREGELIFRYIYQMVGCEKPVDRLWISSLTYHAIKEGFENLKPDSEYDNLYQSARCRSEADWLVGMNGSRVYAIENDMRRLSVGRVLSPTLAILVRREKERRSFVPEEYCEVIAFFGKGEGNEYEGRLVNEETSDQWAHFPAERKEELEQFASSHSGTGTVILAEEEWESQPAQQLYDLTSLQRDANRIYGMSSKRTLDTAQSLYERHKAITYPRTDSRYLSTDLKATLQKRLESFLGGELDLYAQYALIMKDVKKIGGRFILNKGVSDHHAIIPTGEAKNMDAWTKAECQIYNLISRRFIGMFYPDREVYCQVMKTEVDGHIFLSKGESVRTPGWSVVDTSRRFHVGALPELKKGNQVQVNEMRVRTDKTKPPAPHTEASLLAAMEHAGKIVPEDHTDDQETEFGIGTPATRAATIEKMIEKEMAVRKGRALIPTEYGIKLVEILPQVLQSPEMTGEWEAKLSRISKGEGSPEEFMAGIRSITEDVIHHAEKLGDTGIKDVRYVGSCPMCGNPVREYDKAYYCINKDCGFRKIYKAVKGFHPTLHTITMRELLANGTAVTDAGTYTLIKEPPYLAFERAPKPVPDYAGLTALIEEYGLDLVNKVSAGGGMWIAGGQDDELVRDFVEESRKIGCGFTFYEDARALNHHCGWCHSVEKKHIKEYEKAFGKLPIGSDQETESKKKQESAPEQEPSGEDLVLKAVQESGFEYVDKRSNGGCLWFVAGEEEGKTLAEKCKELGLIFVFTPKGGRVTKKRSGWYSI